MQFVLLKNLIHSEIPFRCRCSSNIKSVQYYRSQNVLNALHSLQRAMETRTFNVTNRTHVIYT